jgi:hypothetical protein
LFLTLPEGGLGRADRGLGLGAGAGVEEARGGGLEDCEDGLSSHAGVAGADGHAAEVARHRRRNDVAAADAGLALLEDGDGERARFDDAEVDRHRLGQQPEDDEGGQSQAEEPDEDFGPGFLAGVGS